MACCRCCCGGEDCEEGQEGKCCCGGLEGTCCQEGEYCCDGVCQEGGCCDGPCEGDDDCPPGCVCVEGECEAEGFCCYKDLGLSYSFTFLTYSGTVNSGSWYLGPEYLALQCSTSGNVCGVDPGGGLFMEFYDGTDTWAGHEAGNPLSYPCASSASAAGTYTLTNCTTLATATLTLS